jgi:hypothetical protein
VKMIDLGALGISCSEKTFEGKVILLKLTRNWQLSFSLRSLPTKLLNLRTITGRDRSISVEFPDLSGKAKTNIFLIIYIESRNT